MFPAPATCGGDRGVSVQGEEGADGGGTKGAEKRRKENRERERERARERECWVLIGQPGFPWPSRRAHLISMTHFGNTGILGH